MMENTGYSLADIKAVTENNNDGLFGTGNSFWILVLFLFMFGFGGRGFGFGGDSGALTRAEMYDGFNTNQIMNKLNGLENGLCDGFYNANTTMLQGFNGVGRDLCNIGYKIDSCCCETQNGIQSLKYEMAQNACDIKTAIHAEGEATRALINANVMQDLRDKLADRDREIMTANFQLSQQAQSANLVQELRPCPIPAYITCSPYAQTNVCQYGC